MSARYKAALRITIHIVLIVLATLFLRAWIPEIFYEHGGPEEEFDNWQPIDSLTPFEDLFTKGMALLGIIGSVIRNVKRLRASEQ